MNIFVLDENPEIAAKQACDKHIIKMSLETAQLLCSSHMKDSAPYKQSHVNHPCAIWTRTSRDNYEWLVVHGLALCDEYTRRYGKVHKSRGVIEWARDNVGRVAFSGTGLTPFAQAMPEIYRSLSAVEAYRKYYLNDKKPFATWKSPASPPQWWIEGVQNA